MKYIVWIWRNMAGIRVNTTARIIIGITQVLLGLLMVWLSKQFIDITIRTGTEDDILQMVCTLVVVVVCAILLRQSYYYMSVKASTSQSNTIRLRVFSSLFRRQMFEDQLHSGDVTSRLSKDIDTVADVTTSLLPQFVVTGVQLIGAFLLMYSMDARLALALLLTTPVVVVFGKLFARKLRSMTLDIRQQESVIQMQVQEGMEHNAVLRSLGSELWVTRRLDDMQHQLIGRVMRRTRFTVVSRLLLACTFSLGYLLAFVWGGIGLRNGTISFGVMTSFLQLVGMIQHPILQLLNMVPSIIHCTASIDRLKELESTDNVESSSVTGKTSNETTAGPIRFSDVSFRYAKGDHMVMEHFTHEFKPGSKTAIMGETGIGKTTLFRLLLGFIEPTSGHVDRNAAFCFVPQGNTLMSGTIRYNLQLAKPEATDQELKDVLHTACADFVNELPAGLDTELGERGSGLSEGQSQRIAIARGLLRPGTILLLDEISSALDESTERDLFERLFAAYPDRTFLLITHRTLVAELCDEIIHLS